MAKRVELGHITIMGQVTANILGHKLPNSSYHDDTTAMSPCHSIILTSFQDTDPDSPLWRRNTSYATSSLTRDVTTDINGGHTIMTPPRRHHDSCWKMMLHCLQADPNYRSFKSMNKSGTLSVSKIDSLARILFPFSFISLNVLYWAGFLYYF